MEDRVTEGRGGLAVATLFVLIGISVAWWALALWPTPAEPGWLMRTREVCFGTQPSGLPSPGGWLLLVGEPIGMIAILIAGWGRDLKAGLGRMTASWPGRAGLGVMAAGLAVGLVAAGVRVKNAGPAEPDDTPIPGLARVDRPAPPVTLTDQTGARRSLADLAGRIVLVTFAYAHCTNICPAQVHGVLSARRRLGDRASAVVITVDPWRDPPSRLPAIAAGWEMGVGEMVWSGTADEVTAVLKAWRIPTERSIETGEVAHPATVYIIGESGRIIGVGLGAGRQLASGVAKLAGWPPIGSD